MVAVAQNKDIIKYVSQQLHHNDDNLYFYRVAPKNWNTLFCTP